MSDPQHEDAREQEPYPQIPDLEIDETVAPRPEEEAADLQRDSAASAEKRSP